MPFTLEDAQALEQQGRYQDAIDIYQRLLHADSTLIHIWGCLGALYSHMGDKQNAKKVLQHVLTLQPNHAKAHNNLAKIYAAEQAYELALRHYRDAVHSDPGFCLAHFNLGLLLLQRQALSAATTQFQNVLAIQPDDYPGAYFYLGLLYLNDARLDEAEEMFAQLLQRDSNHIEAWVNRGVVALKQGREQEAVSYFTQALLLDPKHLAARNNMAATFIHSDRYEAALTYYDELLQEDPHCVEYLYNAGIAHMGMGQLSLAQTLFQRILDLDQRHFGAFSNLAAIHMRIGQRWKACEFLERALEIQPDDAPSQFMLHALKGDAPTHATCPQYAQDLFNHYALYYDTHMQQQLQYALPKRIETLCREHPELIGGAGLDLGCGTGLIGEIVRPYVACLTGVDVSAKMLAMAKKKGNYDVLIEAEALDYLQTHTDQYSCVFVMDVLPYIGDLDAIWTALVRRLTPEATVWFSTEISTDRPWQLQSSMRFCHHPDYIQALTAEYGLQMIHQETMVARQQEGQALWVNFFGIKCS